MKIKKDITVRLQRAGVEYEMLRALFVTYAEKSANSFNDDKNIKGVRIVPASDFSYFDATFATFKVRFMFLVRYKQPGDSSLAGKIVCTLEEPSFTDKKEILGVISFNNYGTVTGLSLEERNLRGTFEVNLKDTKSGAELILHFLHLAIEKVGELSSPFAASEE